MSLLNCFISSKEIPASAICVQPITTDLLPEWLSKQTAFIQTWVKQTDFQAKPNGVCLISNATGELECVLLGVKDIDDDVSPWGLLPLTLPEQLTYYIDAAGYSDKQFEKAAISWGLGSYQFTKYKRAARAPSRLILNVKIDMQHIENTVKSVFLVRDLINTPATDMSPESLSHVAQKLALEHEAEFSEIVGDDLLKQNYPAIHAVGRGCDSPPRLIELNWGKESDPKITLVGKGVCFDSGGLDLKPPSGMANMKKDMGGAAHVLGLAKMIMNAKLPIRLRVLIPAVENMVSGSAYHPGDVIKMRNGDTVEVTNTDAEGRLILADALAEASSKRPDLLIDMATLTGAARVALGTDIIALFSNDDALAYQVLAVAKDEGEPMWQLPLYTPYKELLKSSVADMSNSGAKPYAGAIAAGLFLQHFVPDDVHWLHFDVYGWNDEAKPGRPKGGEAFGLQTLFKIICTGGPLA